MCMEKSLRSNHKRPNLTGQYSSRWQLASAYSVAENERDGRWIVFVAIECLSYSHSAVSQDYSTLEYHTHTLTRVAWYACYTCILFLTANFIYRGVTNISDVYDWRRRRRKKKVNFLTYAHFEIIRLQDWMDRF